MISTNHSPCCSYCNNPYIAAGQCAVRLFTTHLRWHLCNSEHNYWPRGERCARLGCAAALISYDQSPLSQEQDMPARRHVLTQFSLSDCLSLSCIVSKRTNRSNLFYLLVPWLAYRWGCWAWALTCDSGPIIENWTPVKIWPPSVNISSSSSSSNNNSNCVCFNYNFLGDH